MITHFRGDLSPSLSDTIQINGSPFDLTGASVKLQARAEGSPTLKINAAATITQTGTSPNFVNEGGVRYDWIAGDVDTDDLYIAWWEVTLPSAKTQKTPSFVLRILDHDPVAVTNYIDREDLKSTLSMTGQTFGDKDIDRAITAASRGIDQACSRRFYPDADSTHIRYYTPTDPNLLTLPIGDLIQLTTLATDIAGTGSFSTPWTLNQDFALEPFNAAEAEQGIVWPYNRIRVLWRRTALRFYQWPRSVQVTGQWGWAQTPEPIKQATGLLASRLVLRARQAPLGIMSIGLEGEAARIARNDPDIAFLLGPFMAGELIA